MSNVDKVGIKKVTDILYEKLMQKISSAEWPSGCRLPSETELAKVFSVSRNSLRAALHRLNALGIVESRNGEGTFVCDSSTKIVIKSFSTLLSLKPSQVLELLELRKGVESISCELAAKRRTEKELKKLRGYVENMKAAVEAKIYNSYAENDLKFHFCIAEMSKNSVIEGIMEILRDTIAEHFAEFAQTVDIHYFVKFHEEIYEAIKRKDTAAAVIYSQTLLEDSIVEVRKVKGSMFQNIKL